MFYDYCPECFGDGRDRDAEAAGDLSRACSSCGGSGEGELRDEWEEFCGEDEHDA